MFNHARDALNPQVNAAALRERLYYIDHYRFRYGASHTYWVHTALKKIAKQQNRYKFNTLVKAFFAYQTFNAVQTYRYLDQNTFMSQMARAERTLPILGYFGAFGIVCLAI